MDNKSLIKEKIKGIITELESTMQSIDFSINNANEINVLLDGTAEVTPTPTVTNTPTPTVTTTVTPTPTPSKLDVTPTVTPTVSLTPSNTPTITSTPTPEPQPVPEDYIDFGNLPHLDFAALFGRTTDAFRRMLTEVGNRYEHFYMKGSFVIDESIYLPKNIKFSFDWDADITVQNNSTVWCYSRIAADNFSYLFKVEKGSQFKLMPGSCSKVSFAWYGADNTREDNYEYMNKAIQDCDFLGSFLIPMVDHEKPYKVSKTVEFVSWQKEHQIVFPTWRLYGEGVSDNAHGKQGSSKIHYTGLSGPCINFRGSRAWTVAKDFELSGVNMKPRQIINEYNLNDLGLWKTNAWLSEGVSLDRYDHHCGIAFDWVAGGLTDSKPWSAQAQVEGVKISSFGVGLSISPSASMQADTIDVRKTKFDGCVYGVSVGQDQARACTFDDVWMDGMHTFYTNDTFGRRNGSLFNIRGGQYTTALKCFQMHGSTAGQCKISEAYFEAVGVIGSFNSWGSNSNPVFLEGCDFIMNDDGYTGTNARHWSTPYMCIFGGSNVTFKTCTFRKDKKYLSMFSNVNGRFTFEGCAFGDLKDIHIDGYSADLRHERLQFSDCTWLDQSINLNRDPVVGGGKQYVRWLIAAYIGVTGAGNPDDKRVKTYLTEEFGSPHDLWGFDSKPEITSDIKEFTIETSEAAWYHEGDYVSGLLSPNLQGIGNLEGMFLNYGQLDPPCLEVIAVEGNKVTFRKLGPEVDMALDNNRWGRPYAYNKCWITTNETPEIHLKPGDWFRDDKSFNRVKSDGNPIRVIEGKVRGR